jgi:nucleoside-diphosphate-sugar epimerase
MYSTLNNIELIGALKPLIQNERILVSGASGWLGKNLIELILDLNDGEIPESVLLTAASSRTIELSQNRKVKVVRWDREAIQEFAPTTFINLAFLTRDRLLTIPVDQYIQTNLSIIDNAIWALSLPSINLVLSTSSGVASAISNVDDFQIDPYGKLKKHEELVLLEKADELKKKLLILRVWTVSGKYIKPGDLLIIQSIISAALANKDFEISSNSLTYRTYIHTYEMFGLALVGLLNGKTGIINSGGIKVEIADLAQRIFTLLNAKARVIQVLDRKESTEQYVSISPELNEVAVKFKISMMDLDSQILNTAESIRELS